MNFEYVVFCFFLVHLSSVSVINGLNFCKRKYLVSLIWIVAILCSKIIEELNECYMILKKFEDFMSMEIKFA